MIDGPKSPLKVGVDLARKATGFEAAQWLKQRYSTQENFPLRLNDQVEFGALEFLVPASVRMYVRELRDDGEAEPQVFHPTRDMIAITGLPIGLDALTNLASIAAGYAVGTVTQNIPEAVLSGMAVNLAVNTATHLMLDRFRR